MKPIIIKSAIKDYVHQKHGISVSAEFFDDLEDHVRNSIDQAKFRATANGRRRIMARDI